jgi:hypothetical protein
MTTNRWHSHHTSCAVIGSYKPCRHSIVEVNFTIIAAEEPVLARQFDDNVDMRHLIEKYTPRMSCISPIRGTGREIRIHGGPSHLQCQLYEYNRPKRGERARISSHGDQPYQLGGHLPLIDCKKIMRRPGRYQTDVPETQLNQELKCRYADRPTAERGPYSRVDFRAKPLFKRPESSKNL